MLDHKDLINNYIEILLETNLHCLIVKGPQGIGKTSAIIDKILDMGLQEDKQFIYLTGYITPLKLYNLLSYCHKLEDPKLFILDDLDSILKNRTCIGLLKSALSEARGKRIVTYESSTSKVDARSCEFDGKLILVTNSFVRTETLYPLLDRGIFYDIDSNPQELAKYIEDNLEQFGGKHLTKEEKESIWEKVKRFTKFKSFSFRAVNRAFLFYVHDKENWYSMFKRTMK